MTIIQVLQSGRPFKRASDLEPGWICYDPRKNGGWFFKVNNPNLRLEDQESEDIGTSLDLYREEILADDWILFT